MRNMSEERKTSKQGMNKKTSRMNQEIKERRGAREKEEKRQRMKERTWKLIKKRGKDKEINVVVMDAHILIA
jgi:hypothetical protein